MSFVMYLGEDAGADTMGDLSSLKRPYTFRVTLVYLYLWLKYL
jgi:hypothetical protein